MPRINRGLTKLLNSPDILQNRIFKGVEDSQIVSEETLELANKIDKLLTKMEKKEDTFLLKMKNI